MPEINTNEQTKTTNAVKAVTLAAALVAAQGEFTAVAKDADNPFFKSEYATLLAVTAMLRPILAKHGLGYTGFHRATEHGEEWVTRIIHESGETLDTAVPFFCADKKPQGYGSAITYFRRYGLQAAFGVVVVGDAIDDDGNRANGNSTKVAPKADEPEVDF